MRASALLLRTFLLGVASGGRSTSGVAALALTTRAGTASGPVAALTGTRGRGLATAAALGELVGDKLPGVPSRLTPVSLTLRMLAGATAAGALAAREHANPIWYVLPGVAGAVAGSIAGARWRAIADDYGWPPLAAALLEDAVVAGLVTAVSRQPAPSASDHL